MKNKFPISKPLLLDFMENFFGYGNLKAPYWFIGKEEGGGKKMEENFRRILLWEKLGKNPTVDLKKYHYDLGFNDHQLTRIQPTWTKLVQIILTQKIKMQSLLKIEDLFNLIVWEIFKTIVVVQN